MAWNDSNGVKGARIGTSGGRCKRSDEGLLLTSGLDLTEYRSMDLSAKEYWVGATSNIYRIGDEDGFNVCIV